MSIIGYVRDSMHEKNIDVQREKLNIMKCENIFTETNTNPPKLRLSDIKTGNNKLKDTGDSELEEALKSLKEGDTLIVYRLDRLGQCPRKLIELFIELKRKGIGFKSLEENIDISRSEFSFTMS